MLDGDREMEKEMDWGWDFLLRIDSIGKNNREERGKNWILFRLFNLGQE